MRGTINGLISALLVGVTLTISKVILGQINVVLFTFLIFSVTFAGLFTISVFQGKFAYLLKLAKEKPLLYLVGFIGALLTLMVFYGLQLSSPGEVAILTRSDLIFSLLLGVIIWHYRLKVSDWLGLVVMLYGIFLVLDVPLSTLKIGSPGSFWLILSSFLGAVNAEIIKIAFREIDGISIAIFNSGVQTVVYFIVLIYLDGSSAFHEFATLDPFLIFLLFLSVISQMLQYITYYRAIKDIPVWVIRVISLLTPVVSTLTSVWWLNQVLKLSQLIGMLIVGVGVLIITLPQANSGQKERAKFDTNV
ncbi:MAG: DMT family transporter [Desulfitobacterium hafniense]|nr:DMT family transporter [Desulfitobacterium hafniense]